VVLREVDSSIVGGGPGLHKGRQLIVCRCSSGGRGHSYPAAKHEATPEERAAIAGTLFTEVRIRDHAIVGATPANPAYLPLIASMTAPE
jgi:hypothetical protein